MAEEEGELVVDPALPVVEVGVAHAAGLHPHHGFTGTGVGDDDGGQRDRLPLGQRYDTTDLTCHRSLLVVFHAGTLDAARCES